MSEFGRNPYETAKRTLLEKELLHLEKSLGTQRDDLLEERAVLRQKLNTIVPPIVALPFEILSAIFCYAVPDPPFPTSLDKWTTQRFRIKSFNGVFLFPVILAAVCSQWRRVAFSTPSLWAHFEFPEIMWNRDCTMVPYHILYLYLQNSKQLPIHLSFNFPRYGSRDSSTLFHFSVDRTLILNLARVHSLSLVYPHCYWLEQFKKMPSIVNLSIDCFHSDIDLTNVRLQIQHCHALARLLLHASPNSGRALHQIPTSLRVLGLSMILIETCIESMLRCPNLVEIYIHNPQPVQEDEFQDSQFSSQDWFSQHLVFNYLTVLLWTQTTYECTDAFLQRMKTPQLHILKLSNIGDGGGLTRETGIRSFINQLPPTLTTLELEGICPMWNTLFRVGPTANPCWEVSVEHFVISRSSIRSLFDTLLALLGRKGTANSEPYNLPLLKSLTIRDIDCRSPQGHCLKSVDFKPLVALLEGRLRPGDRFRLELSGFGTRWMPVVQARFKNLVRSGIELEIIEDDEQVEYF